MNNYSRFITVKKSISNIRGQKQWAQMRWGGCRGCGTAKETIRKKRTKVEIKVNFLTFPACLWIPINFSNLNPNCSNLLDMRNLQEQVKKAFCYQKLFWPFTVPTNWSSVLKIFANFLRPLEKFIQTVKGQHNFC